MKTSKKLFFVFFLLLTPSTSLLTRASDFAQGRVIGGNPKGRASFRGDVADIDIRKAGELQSMIPPEKIRDIRQMHISGVINDLDLKFIKTLANRNTVKDSRGRTVQAWLDLDLRHARIVQNDRYGRGLPVETLPNNAFSNWNRLRSIILPPHLRAIPDYCFSSCSYLEMVEMPPTLEVIGDYAFRSCNKLVEAHIPASVVEIGRNCFSGCSNLANITLPERLTIIPSDAFAGTAISQINIPSYVQQIDARAFANTNLQQVVIPASVQKLAVSAFNDCQRLTAIVVDTENAVYADADGMHFIHAAAAFVYHFDAQLGHIVHNCFIATFGQGGAAEFIKDGALFIHETGLDAGAAEVNTDIKHIYFPPNQFSSSYSSASR